MRLNLNARQLQLGILNNLNTILNSYYTDTDLDGNLKWDPLFTSDISTTELYYSPVDDFYSFYASVSNYSMDKPTLRYLKNLLYINKGSSKVLELIQGSLSSKNTIYTPSGDISKYIQFSYTYEFPNLDIEIDELDSSMSPTILRNKLITMLTYLLFFNEESSELSLNKLVVSINEILSNYINIFNLVSTNLTLTSSDELDYSSAINNTFNESII